MSWPQTTTTLWRPAAPEDGRAHIAEMLLETYLELELDPGIRAVDRLWTDWDPETVAVDEVFP